MSEPHPAQNADEVATGDTDEGPGLSMDLVFALQDALADERVTEVEDLIAGLHEADAADLLELLPRDDRKHLVEILGATFDAEILPFLDASVREEVIEWLGPTGLARAVSQLDSDDAFEVFEDLDKEFQHRILSQLPHAHRMILEEGLSYPEESAGRLMQREFVVIPSAWTVGETIDYMRAAKDLPDDFYDIYIVNPKHHPIGYLPLSRIMRTRRHVRLTEFMETDMKKIPLNMDQEDVAYLFRQYGLVSAPVVDDAGRLLGVITVDDVVHIIDEEAGEDIMKLGGVREQDLYSAVLDTTKARFTWLAINLLTAILASGVISLFDATIEQIVALAVLMPIVASMGGNAGTQTLTVAVRSLAMKDITEANAGRFIGKELLVGSINGVLFALMAGGVTWLWFDSGPLGLVIASAMVINMVVAGLSGTLIPLGLDKLDIDPAIASSVFLTTITDVIGFFAFLGLAAAFLL
jgi:magnesium transporter